MHASTATAFAFTLLAGASSAVAQESPGKQEPSVIAPEPAAPPLPSQSPAKPPEQAAPTPQNVYHVPPSPPSYFPSSAGPELDGRAMVIGGYTLLALGGTTAVTGLCIGLGVKGKLGVPVGLGMVFGGGVIAGAGYLLAHYGGKRRGVSLAPRFFVEPVVAQGGGGFSLRGTF